MTSTTTKIVGDDEERSTGSPLVCAYIVGMNPKKAPTQAPKCPKCEGPLEFTGLPDVSGPVYFRLYKCESCGVVRVDVEPESSVGWG